jgi:hypothetical protein
VKGGSGEGRGAVSRTGRSRRLLERAAIGPAQFGGVYVGAGTEHVTVDRFDEGRSLFLRNGNPGSVDAFSAFRPGDSVVVLRDETIQAGNHVQGYARLCSGPLRLLAWTRSFLLVRIFFVRDGPQPVIVRNLHDCGVLDGPDLGNGPPECWGVDAVAFSRWGLGCYTLLKCR